MTTLPTPASPGPSARQGNTDFAVSIALLVLRLAIGAIFVYHGGGKLFGWFGGPGIAGVTKMMEHLPLPAFLPPTAWAWMAALGEFCGGVSLLLGLLARLGSIPIIVVMLVAIATVHGPNGFVSSKPGAMGYEYNIALIGIALAILIAGPGLVSLDALLFRRGLWARGPQPLDNPVRRV